MHALLRSWPMNQLRRAGPMGSVSHARRRYLRKVGLKYICGMFDYYVYKQLRPYFVLWRIWPRAQTVTHTLGGGDRQRVQSSAPVNASHFKLIKLFSCECYLQVWLGIGFGLLAAPVIPSIILSRHILYAWIYCGFRYFFNRFYFWQMGFRFIVQLL